MSDKTELKPCPFCGCKAVARKNIANQWIVQCGSCDVGRGNHADMPKEFVIKAWNFRANADQLEQAEQTLKEVAKLPDEMREKYRRELNSTGFRFDEILVIADQLQALLK